MFLNYCVRFEPCSEHYCKTIRLDRAVRYECVLQMRAETNSHTDLLAFHALSMEGWISVSQDDCNLLHVSPSSM